MNGARIIFYPPDMPLRIHFLNVGHGDCTLIEFPSGRFTVVDINDSEHVDDESQKELTAEFNMPYETAIFTKAYTIPLTKPQDYIANVTKDGIFRFICTHPDMDHLSGIKELAEKQTILNFWDTPHSFPKPDFGIQTKFREEDYDAYAKLRQSPEAKHFLYGDSFSFFKPDEDDISILSPTKGLVDLAVEREDKNLASYVLLIRYGDCYIFLGGDATYGVLSAIHETYGEDFWKGKKVILKAPHHGRDSGYCQELVKVMQPEYTIVSVGKKPSTDASNKYRQYSKRVWSTRWKGNIVLNCYLQGEILTETEYNRFTDYDSGAEAARQAIAAIRQQTLKTPNPRIPTTIR